ncbi:hypothetical protein [Noviherbaspirillum saxi]|uniref:hypothetical protein n=1 Tax=Noviherbaspirillum saxi TaxID=2320863 RepID=UPI001F25E309|nr:hypothetical protein [Noviherbaspirillum saxi]
MHGFRSSQKTGRRKKQKRRRRKQWQKNADDGQQKRQGANYIKKEFHGAIPVYVFFSELPVQFSYAFE